MENQKVFEPKTCPFFRSYYDSVQSLEDKDRLDFYELVLEHFFSIEEETEGECCQKERSPVAKALFQLTKPVVDNSLEIARKRAEAGAKGGKASKSKAKTKQTQSKKQALLKQNQAEEDMDMDMDMDLDLDLDSELDTVSLSETEPETDVSGSSGGGCLKSRNKVPYKEIFQTYHALCPRLPAIKALEGERKKKTAVLFKKYGLEGITELFQFANDSDFLCGGGGKGFTAKFDWLIKLDNANKVLEGNYCNVPPPQPTPVSTSYQPEARGFVGHAMGLYREQESQHALLRQLPPYPPELPPYPSQRGGEGG